MELATPHPSPPLTTCRLSAFYLARSLSDLPMDFAMPTALIIIVYFMGGLRYNALAFFGIYGVALLSMLVAQVGGCWPGCMLVVRFAGLRLLGAC